ncbi:MAG: cysteine--tRNA ligase [Candidatus Niyogibacteria bacterium RIFCSPHIGHO2_01_FULL_45_28]|uniref:Cysteine--tRNA ligase n=1 Tax=Candidatus Niyogibacteria bacterium RIFCSPLOWO2_02_FULL_45_13 TaxID=1801725 RepID=A0A1G2EXL3_9BACT|nr:MAG: cysteine--tRNA ligase [Candidatus Niyogibacteria bacterium RIFCSPHIGHO2_01_FULL_45_28]OGZ30120.1 MAG: cysteine--tRNA ligase [Candidatus Niyogibacteria bacterium RIFCSPLOWO2_02_FULL_45_13]
MKLFNTLTRKKEIFRPLRKSWVGLYTCGPTVYNFAHIGNLRTYIFEDLLRRTLEQAGYKVKHVMNITDVGHLTSDADAGEDKLEKGAKREGKSVWNITRFYTQAFLKDIGRLNIKKAQKLVPATKEIQEQIKMIRRLFKNGYAYETEQAVYFDVMKFKGYTKLSGQKLTQKLAGARKEVVPDPQKRNPADFALWFKIAGRFKNHIMQWPSPWGAGFPGWHIECSAIASKYLGQPFDIHAGGVDHISVHHTNEIAQSEGAYGKPLAKIWMHGEFLLIDTAKMAKSDGNFLTLQLLINKRFDPLAYRYLVLTSHYRSRLNFTWESLGAAKIALEKIRNRVLELRESAKLKDNSVFRREFDKKIMDDLNSPEALAVFWKNFDRLSLEDILWTDRIFGLNLLALKPLKIPAKIKKLAREREKAREVKDWKTADSIRNKIQKSGWQVEDSPKGPIIKPFSPPFVKPF